MTESWPRKSQRGSPIEWTPNGPEGLESARALKPDAMIVDRQLPGLDGLGVVERLRKDQIQAPVLVLSGSKRSRIASRGCARVETTISPNRSR